MIKREQRRGSQRAQDPSGQPDLRVKILKIRLLPEELQRIRVAAALLDESHQDFLRSAATEKAEAAMRNPELLRRFQESQKD